MSEDDRPMLGHLHGHQRGHSDVSDVSDQTITALEADMIHIHSSSSRDTSVRRRSSGAVYDRCFRPQLPFLPRSTSQRTQQSRQDHSSGTCHNASPIDTRQGRSPATTQPEESSATSNDDELYSHDLSPRTAPSAIPSPNRNRAASSSSSASVDPRQGNIHGSIPRVRGAQVTYPAVPIPTHTSEHHAAMMALISPRQPRNDDSNDSSDALGDVVGPAMQNRRGKGKERALSSSSLSSSASSASTSAQPPHSPSSPRGAAHHPGLDIDPTPCPRCQSIGHLRIPCTLCFGKAFLGTYCLSCSESGHFKNCKRCGGARIIVRPCEGCDENGKVGVKCVCRGGVNVEAQRKREREERERIREEEQKERGRTSSDEERERRVRELERVREGKSDKDEGEEGESEEEGEEERKTERGWKKRFWKRKG
ncbi:Hypothetical protein D9617_4g003590 [Elsinoe fawcettii]|nr:Hypothetical protein D9617_4g003590 [Elsinoe fawcettii]